MMALKLRKFICKFNETIKQQFSHLNVVEFLVKNINKINKFKDFQA